MNFTRTTLIIFIAFLCINSFAQDELKQISEKKLKKDFDQYVKVVEAHPAPHIHISEDDQKKLIKNIKKQLNKDMNVLEFFKLIAPLYTSIKDGHTSLSLGYDWYNKKRKQTGVLPLKIFCDSSNRIYVVSDATKENTISPGSEILEINGMPTSDFIDAIDPYISYERVAFRNAQIERSLNWFLMLEFGLNKSTEIKYSYKKEEKTVNVNHIDSKDWKKGQSEDEEFKRKRIATNKPWDYEKLSDDVGHLKIYSFSIADEAKFDFALNQIFGKIKDDKIQSLIIDVRGNTGGYPRDVSKVLHFLTQEHFKPMALSAMKVSQPYKDYFNNGTSTNMYQVTVRRYNQNNIDINSLFGYKNGDMIKEVDVYKEEPFLENNEFGGDTYLLTDRVTFSAASSLAATFKCYNLGLIIGEETGGTQVFHANSMTERLKNTGIFARMATAQLYTSCFEEDTTKGVIPDFPVEPNIMHLVSGQDFVLNYALRVIKKVNKVKEQELAKTRSGN